MRLAVVDLGTNTFHLLIVDVATDGNFTEVYRERRFIHLAEDGIETIGEAPYERGLKTLNGFALQMIQHKVAKYSVKGTAALRTASNGAQFLATIKAKTGITIQTITGDEEAKLIYYGVRQAIELDKKPVLIIDVGGGSVEFIIANSEEIFWAQSFPVGVAVLYKNFHRSEPIAPTEVQQLEDFLTETLAPLEAAISAHPIQTLIGSSGTFDVLASTMTVIQKNKHSAFVNFEDFAPLYKRAIHASLEERMHLVEIPTGRKKLIVVALILVNFVLKKFDLHNIAISDFAMKEGMLQELILANYKHDKDLIK